jgi:pimeloyl-ACP methyl ester carboxylesterase
MTKRVAEVLVSSVLSAAVPLGASAEMPAPGTVEAAGAAFPVVTAGEGEPVLFVHGALGDYRKWDGLWEDVAAGHRFIAYTQRWFGTTAWPEDKPYARDVQDDDLVAILQALGEPVHLVGLSNGGPVVLRAALRVPELVQSVVGYEPTLFDVLFESAEGEAVVAEFFAGEADTSAAVEAGDDEEAARELIEMIYALPEGGFDRLDPVQKIMVLDNAHTMPLLWNAPEPTPLTCEDLRKITVPVLVIYGAETLPLWQLASRTVAECVPKARLATIEGVGHKGPVAAKDAFVNLVLGFADAQ